MNNQINMMNKNISINDVKIHELLHHLLQEIQLLLKDELVGMYVGGSLAYDCFDPVTSDIDCYILTRHNMSNDLIEKIKALHQHFYISPYVYTQKIEASYIPIRDLINFNPDNMRPYFNEGRFYMAHYGNNFKIELFVLREKGISLCGQNIKDLIPQITGQELKEAIQKNLAEYWMPMLQDKLKFNRDDYQVFAILTMCRSLYSVKIGDITSKKTAAEWVIRNVPTCWNELIEKSMKWKSDEVFSRFNETQQFVKFTLEQFL